MKPIKMNPKARSGMWSPKGKVWFQKNDDYDESNTVRVRYRHWDEKKGHYVMKNRYPKEEAVGEEE